MTAGPSGERDESWRDDPWASPPLWMSGQSVEARNALQNCGRVHPYTCGNNRTDAAHTAYQAKHGGDWGQLVAIERGWLCPVCGYRQEHQGPSGARG